MQQSNAFFATAKPSSLFFRVAIPGLVSMLAMSLYITFEGIFVGRFIGEAAFAAINIGFPIVLINNALADLIGVGSSVPISVALGRKDEKQANNIFTCAIILIIGVAICSGLVIFFSAPFIASLMGAEGILAELAVKYVRVYALMGPVTTIVFAMDNFLRISGFVKGSMLLNIFMSLLTIGFLALFLGLLGMNVEGAALSSSIAMFVCALIALVPFLLKKTVLRFVRPRFSFSMLRQIITCGLPVFLNNIAGRVASILMNSALLRIGNQSGIGGQTAVATYSVMMYAAAVVEPMLYGMCDSVQPAIGYNWGAGSLNRVRDITKVSFLACGVVSVACTLVMCLFPETMARIFVDPSETVLMALSIRAIPMLGIAFLFGWFGFAVQGFLAAIERPLPATVLSICRAMVFPVILIFGLSWMGLDGLWLNYAGTSVLAVILAFIMLLKIQKTMKSTIHVPQ